MGMSTVLFYICMIVGVAAAIRSMYGNRQTVRCRQRYAHIVRRNRQSH
jgi:hypothetical protein